MIVGVFYLYKPWSPEDWLRSHNGFFDLGAFVSLLSHISSSANNTKIGDQQFPPNSRATGTVTHMPNE